MSARRSRAKSKAPKVPRLGRFERPGRKPLGRVFLNGKAHYCGEWGTAACDEEYRRLIGEWLGRGGKPAPPPVEKISIARVAADYLAHATGYYVKNGRETSEVDAIRAALRPLLALYSRKPAAEFGPRELVAVRDAMARDEIDPATGEVTRKAMARTTVNGHVMRLRRMFRWAAAQGKIDAGMLAGLNAVAGLRAGRSDARETTPVGPVPEAVLNATLPALGRVVRSMTMAQVLTGMRPGEICSMRPCDVDRSGDVWVYTPADHKTAHHGKGRVVAIGPRAQQVLASFLDDRPADAFCFSPREAEAERLATLRATRKTPVQPSQESRAKGTRRLGEHYSPESYRRAVGRAVEQINKVRAMQGLDPLPHWHPHQLRHSFAGAARSAFGLEAARTALGHSSADMSEHYAGRDLASAKRVALEIG